jgi:xanthine dehydrogenase YagS FAD-binding subunit
MNELTYQRAQTWAEASKLLRDGEGKLRAQSAGIDNLDLLKEGIIEPEGIVSLLRIRSGKVISVKRNKAIQISSLATLSEIADHPELRQAVPALTKAAGKAATPNIRNAATLGGNLCQQPRCAYYRLAEMDCLRKGGTTCPALNGDNEMHALFENSFCAAVLPSSLAVALTALDARVTLMRDKKESRVIPIEKLYKSALSDPKNHLALENGELMTEIEIPKHIWSGKNAYTKIKPRDSFDWPLLEVAASLHISSGVISKARIVLGAVAMIPWRATLVETSLIGQPLSKETLQKVSTLALSGANPLSMNGYKSQLIEVGLKRTLAKMMDTK